MTETKSKIERLKELGWEADTTLLYDEECIEGWIWTHHTGYEEYSAVGDWNEEPEIPDELEALLA